MKKIFSGCLSVVFLLLFGCKKEQAPDSKISPDQVTTREYQYNTATKKFSPDAAIHIGISSPAGVQLIYHYLQRRELPDSLIYIYYDSLDQGSNVSFELPASLFAKTDMSAATGIRMMIKHPDNSFYESLVKITAFTPPLPQTEGFPASLLPDAGNKIHISGNVRSENGIKQVDILDDATGAFTVVHSITDLNQATTYAVAYDYTYRPGAGNLKVIVTDAFDLKAEVLIHIPVLPYDIYQDVNMGAQGTATVTIANNFFIAATGQTMGSCQLAEQEAVMDFLFYGTSNGPTLYSPSNTANVAANFRCNGTGWTITNSSALKATRFRVLVPGSTATDRIYEQFEANNIPDLDEKGFFDGVSLPSSSTARYAAPPATPAANLFNTVDAYLIWARIPGTDGSSRNCLLRVKDITAASTAGLSTIKFDIYVAK
ncbi:hypothetical protein [Niabella beijingensis]|uniref:hypothetical protein n=1 Tax=Niabella beijingensis TaxID=2872700 RepID=UPI001CBD8659|nr:hypothetical protein [Niabella beijingensis]MBZ4188725.1 hypothetical protein [Niabella beijingensis]